MSECSPDGSGTALGCGNDRHGHASTPFTHPHRYGRPFALAVGLNAVVVAVEAAAGLMVGSLALIADAAHNLADVGTLLLAWSADQLARRSPSPRRTYGFGRATILAALANAILLFIIVGGLALEAVQRFLAAPPPADGLVIMLVAGLGLIINAVSARLLAANRHRDLNVRAAFQHMVADAAVSAGVIVVGLIIVFTGWRWVDPLASLALAVGIGLASWRLLYASFHLAMDGIPQHIDRAGVEAYLRGLEGVTGLHDLHIWALSTTGVAMTAHLVMPDATPDDAFLDRLAADLAARFGIAHATIQVERGDGPRCRLACGQGPGHAATAPATAST